MAELLTGATAPGVNKIGCGGIAAVVSTGGASGSTESENMCQPPNRPSTAE